MLYASARRFDEVGGELHARLERTLSMSSSLADKQPTALGEALIAAAGRAGANTVTYEIGARVGYKAGWPDRAEIKGAENDRVTSDARLCSQLVLQGYVAAALIERLRAQLVLEYFPTDQEADFKSRIAFQLSFGLQLF